MHEVCGTSRVWNLRRTRRSVDIVRLSIFEQSKRRGESVVDRHDEWMDTDVRS